MKKQKPDKKKVILGITGGFGSGKTTVAKMFGRLGAVVLDADKIAHKQLRRGSPGYKKIIKLFGTGILRQDGEIDRIRLAGEVFDDRRLLAGLNRIVHPQVIKEIKDRMRLALAKVVVLDVPLLIESGLDKVVDRVIVVKASKELQIKRIQAKTSLGRQDILKRIRCQLPQSRKTGNADFIIDNRTTLKETENQVARIWKELLHCYSPSQK